MQFIQQCLKNAFARTKKMLFAPFSMPFWFSLGLYAWLANLCKGKNCSIPAGNFPDFYNFFGTGAGKTGNSGIFIAIIVIIAAAVVFLSVLWIVALFIRSRANFMFLDALVRGKDASNFGDRFRIFKVQGNSMFFFQFISTIILLIPGVVAVGGFVLFFISIQKQEPVLLLFGIMGFGVSLVLFLALISGSIVLSLFERFGTLYLYKRPEESAWNAWIFFLMTLKKQPLAMLQYVLSDVCIGFCCILIVAAFEILTCCFCCIGFIVMSLPYLWAVCSLPLLCFVEFFRIEYAKRFGIEYNVDPLPGPESKA